MTKEFWKSKTLLFNVLAALGLVAAEFGFAGFEPDPDMVVLVTIVVNIVLRFVTKKGISLHLRS